MILHDINSENVQEFTIIGLHLAGQNSLLCLVLYNEQKEGPKRTKLLPRSISVMPRYLYADGVQKNILYHSTSVKGWNGSLL